ncbi:ABC transporter ATP-binding protein [Candidatus Sarmatiella mevalonica]|uniref:ABC transporter ATP-binding protein n=1 Tax=Candidatus Sarmatiella mevalonica TaxID=2770581 RepID=UPI001924AE6C|nr:ABC transporter ATP-binding protein [Candidatus Sarmatiella mevalonica]
MLRTENLSKKYKDGQGYTQVLDKISINVEPAETVAILGASGSGKSTLLHLLGLLDTPSDGLIYFKERPAQTNTHLLRLHNIGFVYQFHNLLPDFTAIENIMLPALLWRREQKKITQLAQDLLERVGMGQKAHAFINQLSGGEKQRVAICRSLMNNPDVILADEPTGSLDRHNGESVFKLLLRLAKEEKKAVVIATHDESYIHQFSRVYKLEYGKLSLLSSY